MTLYDSFLICERLVNPSMQKLSAVIGVAVIKVTQESARLGIGLLLRGFNSEDLKILIDLGVVKRYWIVSLTKVMENSFIEDFL